MLQIAKVLKSNGTEGDVLLGLTLDLELDFKEPVFIEFDGLPVPFFFESYSKKGNGRAIARFNDVRNLTDAEELVGKAVYADLEDESDEEADFTGWLLQNRGMEVGRIDGMELIPGNPCLCVGKVLIPLHEDFVISADPDAEILNLNIPEGLL